ncbi:MAG: hypothetical protein ACN4GZ_15110 [Acidimicrobiales bacterium]
MLFVDTATANSAFPAIGKIARRVAGFAAAIRQGHEFGITPGDHEEMWDIAFCRDAVPIFRTAFPWVYLLRMADGFDECDDLMVDVASEVETGVEWTRTQRYLRSVSRAIREAAPSGERVDDAVAGLEPNTPPIMPFRQLAELASSEAASELCRCASKVERICGPPTDNPLNALQIEWMRRLGKGERVIDVAASAGYSERTMYRALDQLWSILGVTSRNEAIALVNERGWLEPAPFTR